MAILIKCFSRVTASQVERAYLKEFVTDQRDTSGSASWIILREVVSCDSVSNS